MNLVEFLKETEKFIPYAFDNLNPNFFQGEILKTSFIYDKLKTLDEFADCDLDIIDSPIFDGAQTQTIKLKKNTKFKGKLSLYSIQLTPVMYDPENYKKPVKDGCVITPVIYDPKDFTPYKEISIRFNVESNEMNEEEKKKEIVGILEKILDKPEDYTSKGSRGIILRGIFTEWSAEEESEKL